MAALAMTRSARNFAAPRDRALELSWPRVSRSSSTAKRTMMSGRDCPAERLPSPGGRRLPQEDAWLRQALEEHVHHTRSPRAERMLARPGALPLMRVQPVHFQGSVEATWRPVLARFVWRRQVFQAPPAAPISRTAIPA